MAPDPRPAPGQLDLFAAGGEAGRLMAEFDWAGTSVGPVESWPASLRFAVRSVLVSRFPTIVLWGPDLLQFYNDAYAPVLGAKHPAIGKDIRLTQPETWAALQPPIDHAMTTLEASWLPGLLLPLERHGYREETYFTVSHAPAFDDAEQVAGIHAVCSEVTGEIVSARRQRLLHDLATAGSRLGDEREVVEAMCSTLTADALDVPFAAVYLAGADGQRFRRLVAVGCDPAGLPETVDPDGAELSGLAGGLGVTGGPFGDPVTAAAVLPLTSNPGGPPIGLLFVGTNPNRTLDEDYCSFHELLAGQFAGAVVTIRAFEAERLRAESLAELDRAKTTFFSDVSHELRTPLTLLLGPIGDVLDDAAQLPPGVEEQLSLAMRNGQRLQRLVNDLLDFASIEAGRAAPTRVATDVATFTAELAGIFRAATERAGLRLTVDCPALERTAYVDPRMWEKIVVNLLANAVKYTFVGGIGVHLRADGDRFELTVTDTGVGIVAEELPQLFHRFHRVPGATARTREGTGIGLALVHELAALHGGSVSVASEPGIGSTFTVALPFGAADAEVSDAPAPGPSDAARVEAASWERDTSRPAETHAGSGSSEGLSVLVVDDNADMRAYLTRLLAPHWTVRTTANGEEALRAVAEHPPSIVLTDVMMPRIDGFQLLQALRSNPATSAIPVIMLTARAGQEASVEGLEAGADDYLAKPFRAPELLARVRVVLERTAGRRSAAQRTAALTLDTAPMPVLGAPGGPAAAEGATMRAGTPTPRRPGETIVRPSPLAGSQAEWRLPAAASSVPVLRRRLRALLDGAGVDPDLAYDLLLAACEAATNAIEHAQLPIRPSIDVSAAVADGRIRITVRDYGQWRERGPSMDRGRGSTLMSAFGQVTATPSPAGTTVVLTSSLTGPRASTG